MKDKNNRIYIVSGMEDIRQPESPIGFARGLREQIPGIIDEYCEYRFDPSYIIDKNGNIRFREISLVRKQPED